MTSPQHLDRVISGLTEKAASFVASVGINSWWRTEEGERVPQSLITKGLIERDRTGGIDFSQYRLTDLGILVRDRLSMKESGDA